MNNHSQEILKEHLETSLKEKFIQQGGLSHKQYFDVLKEVANNYDSTDVANVDYYLEG